MGTAARRSALAWLLLLALAGCPSPSAAQVSAVGPQRPRVEFGAEASLFFPYGDFTANGGGWVGVTFGRWSAAEFGFERSAEDFRKSEWGPGMHASSGLFFGQFAHTIEAHGQRNVFVTIGGGIQRRVAHYPGDPTEPLPQFREPYTFAESDPAFLAGLGWQRTVASHLAIRTDVQLIVAATGASPRVAFGAGIPIGRYPPRDLDTVPSEEPAPNRQPPAAPPSPTAPPSRTPSQLGMADWSRVRTLAAATGVSVTTSGQKPAIRYMVRADETSVVFANLTDPALGPVRDRILYVMQAEPDRLAAVRTAGQLNYGLLRISPDGVFFDEAKLASVEHLLERVSRADVTEIASAAQSRSHWKIGLAIGAAGGVVIGTGVSGNCDGGGSCARGVVALFGGLGAGIGALVGALSGVQPAQTIYHAAAGGTLAIQPVIARNGAGVGATIAW